MADLKISDHTADTIGLVDWVPIYRESATTSDLRVKLGTAASASASDFATAAEGALAASALQNLVEDTTPQLGGTLDGQGNIAQDIELQDYSETVLASATASSTVTADFASGSIHPLTLVADITSVSISNPPAAGEAGVITFVIKQDGTGGRSWAHPSGTLWPDGTAPTLSSASSAVDVISYMTTDGGTVWYGFEGGLDFS